MRTHLARRISLPRWSLWVFLAIATAAIVVIAALNWTQVNTTLPTGPGPEEPPVLPELVGPGNGAVVTQPVDLNWAMPQGPGPVEVRVVDPTGRVVLAQTCLVDSLRLAPEVLSAPGSYRWRVIPPGLPPRTCPEWSFRVLRDASGQAP